MSSGSLSPLHFFTIIVYAAIMGGSQIIMVKASKQIGQNFSNNGALYALFYSHWVYIAILFYILATGFWMAILYKIDIRVAYPIASTAVLFAAIFQSIITKSYPSIMYWIGLVLILTGLAIIQHEDLVNK